MNKTDNNTPGLHCPACQFKIKFTMDALLYNKGVSCPSCGLELGIQVPATLKKHIQEIVLAEQMVEQAKKFSR